MSYLGADRDKIFADPAAIIDLYGNSWWRQFSKDLGPKVSDGSLTNELLAAAFCAICAWDVKPYGTNPNRPWDVASLLKAKTLACNGYVALAWGFLENWSSSTLKVVALGWAGGPVASHIQMLVSDRGINLLLDPTVGIIVRGVTYDSLVWGRTIDMSNACNFYGKYNGDPLVKILNGQVWNALRDGTYRPSHCECYVRTRSQFVLLPPKSDWLTPASQDSLVVK